MTIQEFALRLLSQLRPMVPALAAAAIVTFAAVLSIYLLARKSWVEKRSFGIIGLFFGLRNRECLRLACCWLKLVFVTVFILLFQRLEMLHYWMVLVPGVLSGVLDSGLGKKLEGIFWLALQLVGLLSTNLVCRFITEMSGSTIFLLIYGAMGLFLFLFSLYLFVNEMGSISQQRTIDPHGVWAREESEPQR